MICAIVATLRSAVFFGAAVYISIVQHPAALSAGGEVPGRLFQAMYRRAAPMQAALAVIGTVTAVVAWLFGLGWLWLLGALLQFSPVPFTLVRMKSVNARLPSPAAIRNPPKQCSICGSGDVVTGYAAFLAGWPSRYLSCNLHWPGCIDPPPSSGNAAADNAIGCSRSASSHARGRKPERPRPERRST